MSLQNLLYKEFYVLYHALRNNMSTAIKAISNILQHAKKKEIQQIFGRVSKLVFFISKINQQTINCR